MIGIQIVAYITSNKNRIISGAPLLLFEEMEEEKEKLCIDLSKALKCDVVQLRNGDYLLIKN